MAAHPLRASRPLPAASAAALHILRPIHGNMYIHPLGRRYPSSVPLKIRARNPFRSNCENRADNFHQPEPEPEPENHDSDRVAPSENFPLVDEMLRKIQAAGVRETPSMYIVEKEQISNYKKKLSSSRGTDVQETVMALIVCTRAQEGLDLASHVMDIASIRRGTISFSQHTVNQMVRTYAAIFCNVAKDAYHMKFEMETFLSFVAALRGLGAIYHILAQDTVAKLKDGRFKNSITYHMGKHSQEFDKAVKYLEDIVVKIKPQEGQMKRLLLDGLHCAHIYIASLANCREAALSYLKD